MHGPNHISRPIRRLIEETERIVASELIIHRERECPISGLLLDVYSYDLDHNVIVYPASYLGLLKDLVIAWNCAKLLLRGVVHGTGDLKVLSYSKETAITGGDQIYLDILKDSMTKSLDINRKKKIIPLIFHLFHEGISELPLGIVSHIFLARNYPLLRNAQVYLLIKEGMYDMHELVSVKDLIPRRYFVLHNALYYTRDALLADYLSAFPLNPVINIPELRRFKNLDLKETMTHRWTGSAWYHTKIAGDDMFTRTRKILENHLIAFDSPVKLREIFLAGKNIAELWTERMAMKHWFRWVNPAEGVKSEGQIREIEERMIAKIFTN
ncbi:MAG: hypothetical protein QHG99_04520 [Methanomicrobiales archaeon]|nr:hypothetical protein [Methanomicrobiales archaeon]